VFYGYQLCLPFLQFFLLEFCNATSDIAEFFVFILFPISNYCVCLSFIFLVPVSMVIKVFIVVI